MIYNDYEVKRDIKIIPSLASANQMCLGNQIKELKEYPFLHIDIEDGNFVPNITFGMKTILEAGRIGKKIMDAHLMVMNPEEYIDPLIDGGITDIAIHVEAVNYPAKYLQRIKDRNGRAGVAFNFMAQPEQILPYLALVDYVLIMTSEPDGKAQKFNGCMLEKIRRARTMLPERVSIIADGGISEENMKQVIRSGADTLVMGRAVWGAPDAGKQITRLMEELREVR